MMEFSRELNEQLFLRELSMRIQNKAEIHAENFSDCTLISIKLAHSGIQISAHTLARFFGLLKEKHRPYNSTLDLLCTYIDFGSFKDFCKQTRLRLESELCGPRDVFQTGSFSFIALEIAIVNSDWINVKRILSDLNDANPFEYELVMFLGNSVRKHPKRSEFIRQLASFDIGRKLFFESFVDEDDPDGYFSEALLKYYARTASSFGNNLFLHTFIGTKKIYHNSIVNKIDLPFQEIVFRNLHFHEISRYLECQILVDHQQGVLERKLNHYIEILLKNCENRPIDECSWILARPIKALAFTKQLKKVLASKEIETYLINHYFLIYDQIKSIADLIIQFVVHCHFKFHKKKSIELSPLKIQYKHDNETNARILIESATACLYAPETIKDMLKNNVNSFANKTGQTWVSHLMA